MRAIVLFARAVFPNLGPRKAVGFHKMYYGQWEGVHKMYYGQWEGATRSLRGEN